MKPNPMPKGWWPDETQVTMRHDGGFGMGFEMPGRLAGRKAFKRFIDGLRTSLWDNYEMRRIANESAVHLDLMAKQDLTAASQYGDFGGETTPWVKPKRKRKAR